MDLDRVRKYQDRAVAEVLGQFDADLPAVVEAGVGAGKTRIMQRVAAAGLAKGERWCVLQETEQLMLQNERLARGVGFDTRVAGRADAAGGDMVLGVVNTVAAAPAAVGRVDVLWIDEVHHAVGGGMFAQAIEGLRRLNPAMRVGGATATYDRADDKAYHPEIARARRVQVTWGETIKAGMVLPIVNKVGRLAMRDGSVLQQHVREAIDPARPARSAIGLNATFRRLRPDDFVDQCVAQFSAVPASRTGQFLAFTDETRDAEAVAEALVASGRPTAAIHSRMASAEIGRRVDAYRRGELQGLASVDMIGEGFDAPSTASILNCKVTMSSVEYVQNLGRLTRGHAGKSGGTFLDMGGSTQIHGRLDVIAAVQDYVRGGPGRKAPEPGEAPGWEPWVGCGPGEFGVDLGSRLLFAKGLGKGRVLVAEVDKASPAGGRRRDDARAVLTRVGVFDGADFRTTWREAVASASRTVITLCSDIGTDGRSAMQARVAEASSRYAGSLRFLARDAEQVARKPAAARAQASASR